MTKTIHVAWDFDGTLIDSFSAFKQAARTYCEAHSLVLPDDHSLRSSFGNTRWSGFKAWEVPVERQEHHRFGIYREFYEIQKATPDQLPLVSGLYELIKELKENGFLQSIVTSRPREALLAMLAHHRLDSSFDHLDSGCSAEELGLRDKPYPDKLLHTIKAVNSDASRTLVIGDTEMDVGMAKQANCKVIAVSWGMGNSETLARAGASHIVSTVQEVREIVYRAAKS